MSEPLAQTEHEEPTTTNSRSLRRGVAWTVAGNVVYLGCQYGMLIAIAKFGDPSSVGQFALALAVAAPIMVLSQMQLRQLQVTDVRGEARFGDYLWHRILLTAAALLVIVAVAATYESRAGLVIAWIGAAKSFESVSDVAYGRLQRNERMELVAVSMMAKGTLSLGVLALLMATVGDVVWAAAGLAGVWALLLFAFDLPVQRWAVQGVPLELRGRPKVMKQLARSAWPLAWTSGLIRCLRTCPVISSTAWLVRTRSRSSRWPLLRWCLRIRWQVQ